MFFHMEPNGQGNFMAVFGFDYRCETASLQAMKFRTRSIPSKKKTKLKKRWHYVSHIFYKSLACKELVMQKQAKINDKNRRFGVFMTPLSRRNKNYKVCGEV